MRSPIRTSMRHCHSACRALRDIVPEIRTTSIYLVLGVLLGIATGCSCNKSGGGPTRWSEVRANINRGHL
jgi:hypothetical protein